jgi:hypothetical protein
MGVAYSQKPMVTFNEEDQGVKSGPADAIGNAVMIAEIATGEIEGVTTEDGRNAAAVPRAWVRRVNGIVWSTSDSRSGRRRIWARRCGLVQIPS